MSEVIKTGQAISRTPELIAAEINDIKEQTKKILLYNSIEIGRRLVEAKELLKHGEWGEWLKKSINYSQRTANNLMRIFEEYGSEQISLLNNSKSQTLSNLTYTQAVALLEINQEERESFVVENNVKDLSTRELQKLIKAKEEAINKAEKYRKGYKEKEEEAQELLETLKKTEADKILAEIELKEKIDSLNEKIEQQANNKNLKEREKLQEIQNKEKDKIEYLEKINTKLRKENELLQLKKEDPIELGAFEVAKINSRPLINILMDWIGYKMFIKDFENVPAEKRKVYKEVWEKCIEPTYKEFCNTFHNNTIK